MDVFSFLFRESKKKVKDNFDKKDKEKIKRRKLYRIWANLLPDLCCFYSTALVFLVFPTFPVC